MRCFFKFGYACSTITNLQCPVNFSNRKGRKHDGHMVYLDSEGTPMLQQLQLRRTWVKIEVYAKLV